MAKSLSYSGRFRFAYAGLALLFWVIVGIGTVLIARGTVDHQRWSSWQPTASGVDGAQEIANHVAPNYRLEDDTQLVAVQAHGPEVQNVPLSIVAIRTVGGNVKGFSPSNSVVYVLCGGGTRCSIPSGTKSPERLRLLRREAIELALYSFKYLDLDSVITFLPPAPDSDSNWSIFLRKDDLKLQLEQPLTLTLPATAALTPLSQTTPREADELARRHWFSSAFEGAPDGGAALILNPLSTAG